MVSTPLPVSAAGPSLQLAGFADAHLWFLYLWGALQHLQTCTLAYVLHNRFIHKHFSLIIFSNSQTILKERIRV